MSGLRRGPIGDVYFTPAGTGVSDIPVQDMLSATSLAGYTELRSYAGSAKHVYVTGYLVSSTPSGSAGLFTLDDTDTTSSDNGGTIIVSSNGKRWKRVFSGKLDVRWFGAVADLSTDCYSAIVSAASAAANRGLVFPNEGSGRGYAFGQPLTITGIDVDFDGSDLKYTGTYGSFALTLNSSTGSGTSTTTGNKWVNFTLYQSDFTEFTTYTGSAVYDPPSIAAGDCIWDITPGGLSTTVSVPGARAGGFATATFDALPSTEGIEITAQVTADDVVTVTFSNHQNLAVDMASGTISVTVYNNAYHGLCIGGGAGKVQGRVRGFTGVSFGVGNGVDMTSGVTFSGQARCYYWDIDLVVVSAAGWPCIVPPRNNDNEISLVTFPMNAYGDHRANCINQLVIGGVANRFRRCSLEANPTDAMVVFLPSANHNYSVGSIYTEYNTSYPTPPFPRIVAKRYSSANLFDFRHTYSGRAISDKGTANRLKVLPGFWTGVVQTVPPMGGRNLVKNGDFENGLKNWTDSSTGSTFAVSATAGAFSGKRVRIDVVAGRPNLLQDIVATSGLNINGLIGQNITARASIKTNIAGIVLRFGGQPSNSTTGDETEEPMSVPYRVPEGATTAQVQIISSASSVTGYVEVSNVTGAIGLESPAIGERSVLEGTATYNPPSLAAGAAQKTTVTVTGAVVGDKVVGIAHTQDSATGADDISWNGKVTANDTVTVWMRNNGASSFDMLSGTLSVRVQKQ